MFKPPFDGYLPDDEQARSEMLEAIITPIVKRKLLAEAELEYLADHYELASEVALEIEHRLVFAGYPTKPDRT